MTYEDYDFEHWDAHDYGEYDPGPDDDGDANWYAEEGERFMRAEVYEPLERRLRDGID